MPCIVVSSQSQLQARLPQLSAKLPASQGDWTAFLNELTRAFQALQQETHAPNVIPAQFQTFQTAAATPVLAALTTSNLTAAVDGTVTYYGSATLKLSGITNPGSVQFTGTPIPIAPGGRWFCSFQIIAPSGATGSLTVKTSTGATFAESFTVPSSANAQQVWGLFDLTANSDPQATWILTFTSTSNVNLDGFQMNAVDKKVISFLPRFAGTQMIAGAAAYAQNLDGISDGTARIAWDPPSKRRGVSYGQNLVINGDFGRGDTRNWTRTTEGYTGASPTYTGPTVSADSTANIGGYSGVFGGTNSVALTDYLIPVDTTKNYYIEVRVKDGGGTGSQNFYAGFACFDSTKASIPIEPAGATFNYDLASNIAQPGSYTIYSDTISGVELIGNHSVAPNDSQFTSHSKFRYGTAYICPMFLPNRGASGGLFTVDYVRIVQIASLDNEITDGITYARYRSAGMTGGKADPSKSGITATGSVPPIILGCAFSWTTTSGQIVITWPAFTIYRPDGTTTSISAGAGTTVTGLTNATVYTIYPYIVDGATTVSFATGASGSAGSPAICYAGGSGPAAQLAYAFANIPLQSFTATPSAGGGGGGGDQIGCLHPDTLVELDNGRGVFAGELGCHKLPGPCGPTRITHISRKPCSEWVRVRFRDGGVATVTPDHRFLRPDDSQARAAELHLGDVLAGRDKHVEVEALEALHEKADMVMVNVEYPHLYYLAGALSHNGNPKP